MKNAIGFHLKCQTARILYLATDDFATTYCGPGLWTEGDRSSPDQTLGGGATLQGSERPPGAAAVLVDELDASSL